MKSIITISALLLLSVALVGNARSPDFFVVTPDQQQSLGIVTQIPERASDRQLGPLPAQVTVPNSGQRSIAAQVEAVVSAVYVQSGDRIERGQPLLQLSGPQVVGLYQELVVAHSEQAVALSRLKGDEALHEEGAITDRRLIKTRADYLVAQARLLAAESSLRLAGVDQGLIGNVQEIDDLASSLEVVAPFAGMITEQWVSPGSQVASGTPLLMLINDETLQLEIHTPVSQCSNQLTGQQVSVKGYSATGTILTVGCNIHAEDQGVLMRSTLNNTGGVLRPGQLVDAMIQLPVTGAPVWRVPREGVTRHNDALWLFAKTATGFRPVAATPVAQEPDAWLVRAALSPSTPVATKGSLALKAIWLGAGGED